MDQALSVNLNYLTEGGAFLFVEVIPSSGSICMVWDMAPIEIMQQSIFWRLHLTTEQSN